MHENPQRVSSVVRIDVSGPYLQGVFSRKLSSQKLVLKSPQKGHCCALGYSGCNSHYRTFWSAKSVPIRDIDIDDIAKEPFWHGTFFIIWKCFLHHWMISSCPLSLAPWPTCASPALVYIKCLNSKINSTYPQSSWNCLFFQISRVALN